MKKTLAIVLSLLVAFSMFTVMGMAADEPSADGLEGLVKVTFVYGTEEDKEVIETIYVAPGTAIASDEYVPAVPTSFFRTTTDENGNESKFKYTFKGWKSSVDGAIYYPAQLPTTTAEDAGKLIVYSAEYSVEDYSERQSFWNFIESLFERINKLFEYFATIFNF